MKRTDKITPNFSWDEFIRAADPIPSQDILDNIERLANRLQVIRDLLNCPITLTSGYRTPEHNKAVGGEDNSYHLKGMAADIVVGTYSANAVQKFLRYWSGGMGEYKTFTHLDIGPKRRWK